MKKIKPIFQNENVECGLACLAMVLNHHGYETSLLTLRTKFKISANGLSLYHMIKILSEYNLLSRPLSLDISQLKQISLPAVILWNKYHYVILESVSNKGIQIIDPALGRRRYQWKDASLYFSGVALEIWPSTQFTPYKDPNKKTSGINFLSIIRNIPRLKYLLVIYTIPTLIALIVQLVTPKLFNLTVDDVIVKNDNDFLFLLLYIYSACFLVNFLIQLFGGMIALHIRSMVNLTLTSSVVQSLSRMPVSFFERRSLANIMRKSYCANECHSLFTDGYINLTLELLFAFLLLILMFIVSVKMSFIILGISSIYFIIRFGSIPFLKQLQSEIITSEINRDSIFYSLITNISTIKLYNSEEEKVTNWCQEQGDTEKLKAKSFFINNLIDILHTAVSNIHILVICYCGTTSILSGDNTLGELFAFLLYKDMFMSLVITNTNRFTRLKILSVELKKLDDLIAHEVDGESDLPYLHPVTPLDSNISQLSLIDISYSYGLEDEQVLNKICIELKSKEKMVIYGKSGSGKTTLLKIIAGLYKPSSGTLFINGVPLEQYGLKIYRSKISLVTHHDEILDDNIINNIIYGVDPESFDLSLITTCISQAGLQQCIEYLPYGLNTVIGMGGVNLSSGQKQRLLIARALYRCPDVILFDEPTSHLDDDNRDEIIKTISELNAITIIITHDNSFDKLNCYRFYLNNSQLTPIQKGSEI